MNSDFDFDNKNSLSFEEYKERLIYLLEPILQKTFYNNFPKQKIHKYIDRINFSCPVCSDSAKSNYKKRGNFILKGKYINYFKCHNCGEFKRIDKFFEEFNISLQLDVINYISKNIIDFNYSNNSSYDLSIFLDIENIDYYAIDREEFKNYFGLIEVKNSTISNWLKNRLLYCDEKFLYNPLKNYLAILNLTKSGKIIGLQRRLFVGENKYLTYTLSKLYELMKKENEIPEEIDAISQLFNICLINFNKPVNLLEGPLDSFFIKNSIANCGASKTFPFDIPKRFIFDDDVTGRKHSLEEINKGNDVFLWNKIKKDFDLPIRKKWDINDVIIYFKKNNIKVPIWEHYFSDNMFDAIDI